ncbi:uncharacterized protein TTMY_0161 [Thermus thermophilus]|nr:uncharacterized protein TTMY_0161 [Thermus thermophilus]BDB11294.1 hypothetical protein TthTMY_10330 [Thermus thermophilus]
MYKSPREAHEARIYTGAYRVYGMIHLVPGAGTADLLEAVVKARHQTSCGPKCQSFIISTWQPPFGSS